MNRPLSNLSFASDGIYTGSGLFVDTAFGPVEVTGVRAVHMSVEVHDLSIASIEVLGATTADYVKPDSEPPYLFDQLVAERGDPRKAAA